MTILIVGRFYAEGFASFIADELTRLGHRVVRYDPGPSVRPFKGRTSFYVNRGVALTSGVSNYVRNALGIRSSNYNKLRSLVIQERPIDLTLSTNDFLTPADAEIVKKETKSPLVLWFPDAISNFQKQMFLNCSFDYLFFKDPYIVDILRRNLAAPAFYLPECCSPQSFTIPGASPSICSLPIAEICTAGNLYPYRVEFFRNLSEYDIKLWGLPAPRWMRLGPVAPMVQNRFVGGAEKAYVFRGAKIVINNLHPAEIWGTNVRTFEVCGAGGFQLLDWRPGLSQLFELDAELVAFKGLSDLRRKIEHYLDSPDERSQIANRGRKRALRDHTYANRMCTLLETVGGGADGFPLPNIVMSVN